jgi:alanine racemase
MQSLLRPTRAEINLDNLRHNLRQFRRHLPSATRIMAVVKADAYGHGAVEIARQALTEGAEFLGVALVEEGIHLRRAGLMAPILVFGSPPPELVPLFFEYHLIPTVYSLDLARRFSAEARQRGENISLHVKVDTGMGRVGIFPPEDAVTFLTALQALPGLRVEGIYTHLAAADEKDRRYTERQLSIFARLLGTLEERGLCPPLKHAANSAAAMLYPAAWLDMVRLGISMYGHYPSQEVAWPLDLKPLLTLKSVIAFLKEVPPGTSISYGRTYTTGEKARIASIPLGYADGYNRRLSNRGFVLVRGQRVPVVGRVCMDQFLVRVDAVPGVAAGDEVVLVGRQGEEEIPAEDIAALLGTINYEVLCAISARVPRVYRYS